MPTPIRADIDLIVFDFDGVMTDNRVFVFDDGREAVACNRGDGLGIDRLRRSGLAMLILSTETNSVVARRAEKLKLPVLHGVADKEATLAAELARRTADPDRVLYVGNDTNDLAAMRLVGWTAAPADAHPSVRAIASVVTSAAGGAGVVRELADLLLGDGE